MGVWPDLPQRFFYERLSLNGAGADFDAAVDGSITPQSFRYIGVEGERAEIRMLLCFIQATTNQFTAERYGSVAGPLANGVKVGIFEKEGEEPIGSPQIIKSNAEWGYRAAGRFLATDFGSGDNFITVAWDFSRDSVLNRGIILDGTNEFIEVLIQDDLSSLGRHEFELRGHRY